MAGGRLRGDCTRCEALCCVALAFEQGVAFAFDKAAGEPCAHLAGHRCGIHAERAVRGFGGCVGYDCFGAGQRVSELFAGRSWRDDEGTAREVMEAFSVVRELHEQRLLLSAVERLPLADGQRRRLSQLRAALDDSDGWSAAAMTWHELAPLARSLTEFCHSLRGVARKTLPIVGTNRCSVRHILRADDARDG